ncbi:Chymotrypsin-like elastase family member 1 [Trichinella pseudospiralis]|uniref:Chymotrypsin-like elastase family member 1 n=1 Tax=Trichinella pseudospiralis TaxID=6337 RepID=A0A0V1ICZ6_TRIPS|nr:Chymotrypsin-like elastase family member 1 [Trichinella pseudospiralis]
MLNFDEFFKSPFPLNTLNILAFAKYECGTTAHPFPKSLKANRISGGSVVIPNSVPYQARLLFEKFDGKLKGCGGSLIELKPGNGSQWVLTAAHCTYYAEYRRDFAPEKVEIILGAHRPAEKEKTQLTVGAKRIISHPRYDDRTLAYDISLVLLKEYVVYNNEIRSVCMPKAGEPLPMDVPCYVSGWGKTYHGGQGSDVLKIAEMNILKKEECRIPGEQHAIIFCAAGVSRSATCQGDSGGPLVCLKNNRATLYGIVSAGPVMCGDLRQPGEFTRVPAMMEWIQQSAQRVDSAVPPVSRYEPKPNEKKEDKNDKQTSARVQPEPVDNGKKDIVKDFMNNPIRDNVKDTTNNYKGSDVFNFIHRETLPSRSRFPDFDQMISNFMSPSIRDMTGGSFFSSSPGVYRETRITNKLPSLSRSRSDAGRFGFNDPAFTFFLLASIPYIPLTIKEFETMFLFKCLFLLSYITLAFAKYECGTTAIPFPTSVKSNRIAGGSVATPNSIPYQARLVLEKHGNKVKLCGGTLIEMKPGNGSQWVILGAHRPNEDEKTQVKVGAKRIISHPRYDDNAVVYDVSLILLKEYVIYNNEIRSACLPKAGEPVPMDVPCYASGWGLTYHGGRGSDVLRIAEMNILPNEECRIKAEDKAIIFCAFGASRSATCQGDSGGPLVCLINNKATLYGITSFGPPMCGDLRHSVKFARVPAMMEWIKDTAQRIDSTVPAVSRFEPKPNSNDKQQPSPSVNPGKVDDRQKDITKDFMNIPSRENVKNTNDYKGSDVFNFIYRDNLPSRSRFPDFDQMISGFMSPGIGGMTGGSFFSSSPGVFRETRTTNKLPSVSRSRSDVGRFGFNDPAFTFFLFFVCLWNVQSHSEND